MARAKSVSDEQLLEVARAVFLQDGVGASTLRIARCAGVSEALLFKRFSSKEELFSRAMRFGHGPDWVHGLETRVGQGEVRAQLADICTAMAAYLRTTLPQMMMLWSARRVPPQVDGTELPPLLELKALTHYLQAEMERGRLRRHHPEVVARALQGAVFNHVFMDVMGMQAPLPTPTFVGELLDSLWGGLSPLA
jgi:AcrR family transcriptional regulator